MDLNGIWKGEYTTEKFVFSTGKEIPVPFVIKIKSTGENSIISVHRGLFEGICQDDPEFTQIKEHATLYGSLDLNGIFFVKQYPKLLVRNNAGGIEVLDGTHPEVYYRGEFDGECFRGSWNMHRTFRKIDERVCELIPMKGMWWMAKL